MQRTSSITDQLQEFIDTAKSRRTWNAWISDGAITVYLRKSKRCINGAMLTCLDIASIEVSKSSRNKGAFKAFLTEVIAANPWDGVYIENVMHDWFGEFFKRQGFAQVAELELDLCFYLPKTETTTQ